MQKNLIVLPSRNEGRQPESKRPLILSVGGRSYEIRVDAKITEIRDKPAEVIAIDDGKRTEA